MPIRAKFRRGSARSSHKSPRFKPSISRRRRQLLRGFERLEDRTLLAVDVLAPLVDGYVTDTNKDGSFPDITASASDIRVRDYPNTAGYPGDDRGVLEFDASGIGAGLTVDSAEFSLQRNASYGGYATVDVFAYAADGVLTSGDATVSATLVGTVVMNSAASSYTVPLDASAIQSVYDSSNHIGIRLAIASSSSGFGFGMYSTEGTPQSIPSYAPRLTLTTSGTPVPSLKVTLDPAAIAENAGNSAVTATVERLNADTSADLTVTLSTNDATEAAPSLPNVTILAGSATANFNVDVFDDDVLDGNKSVSITATAVGILDGDASLLVTDYESLTVTAADSSVVESAGAGATTVTITRSNTDISTPLTVTLTDTNPRLTVPASATILANEASVTVPVDVIDTEIVDGNATVLVKANATGYQQGQTSIVVQDDDGGMIRPGNILVAVENRYVKEYKPDGTLIQTFVAFPQDSGAGGQFRDVVVNDQGDIEVINANSTLSNIDVETKVVTNHTDPDWSTGGNLTAGGVARLGQYLYVNDVGTTRGVIRFDTLNGYATTRVNTAYDIHDVTIGLDGKLYALESGGSGDEIAVINPLTMQILDNIKLQFTTHRGIAVNAAGEIFATGWQESIYKYDSQGNLIDFFATGWELDDIDIDSTGRIVAAGDAFGLSHKYVVMTDEKFQTVSYFPVTDDNELFVAFADPDTTAVTPVVTTSGTPATLIENGNSSASTSVIIDPGLTLSDDGDVMTGAVVRITGNYVKGQDSLSAFSQSGIVVTPFNSKTGTLSLSGTASVAAYQAALRSVRYVNSSNSPNISARTITFSAIDEGWAGNSDATVLVVSSNDGPPVANDDSFTVEQDGVLQITPVATNRITLQSDSGEFVGQGQNYTLNGYLSIGQQYGTSGVWFRYNDGNLSWELDFWSDAGPLAVGSYPVATRLGGNGTARLDISGNGRGSGRHFGSFDVHEVEYDGSTLIRFAASFVQYTESRSKALRGTIDYRSTHTTKSGVIINDTDTDGGRLTVVGTTTPANGNVVMQTNGVFEYTPHAGFFGSDSFDYTLQDSDGATTTATATIEVTRAPGFTVTGAPLSVDESGTTDTFDVVLHAQPASDVVLLVTSNDTTEATVAPATLTFTSANWNTPQTVTVTGVDDLALDGSQTTTLTVSVNDANSDDAFDPVADQSVSVTTMDDDSGTLSGTKFEDVNANGQRDTDEPVLPGVTVYLDLNDDGILNGGTEPSTITDANGDYAFTNLAIGDYVVREVVPAGYEQTYPNVGAARLFAIDPNVTNPTRIVEVDPISGATLNSFSVPGTLAGSTAGLAFDGQTIFFIDAADDTLYELNPDTGAILDSMALSTNPRWDGIAALNGLVYINDPFTDVIEVINPVTNTIVNTINLASYNFLPFGGLGELPDTSGGQLVAPIGNSDVVVLLDPVTGEANSTFGHAFVSNGDAYGVTSIDGELYLGFNDPLGTVLVYTPNGALLRSFQTGFGMSGLGAGDSEDGSHRVTVSGGQSLTSLDFGNRRTVGSIAGTKFEDINGNGRRDTGEGPLSGVTIYLDINDNGALDTGEPSTFTDASGNYFFSDVLTGDYVVREVVAADFIQTAPRTNDAFFFAVAAVNDELITIDAVTGQVSLIGPFGANINAIAHTRSGELFVLQSSSADGLYSVDVNTGAATLVGPTGDVVFGMAYDGVTDTIYTLRNLGGTRRLATIDRTTGATTIIGTGSGLVANIGGLAFDPANNRVIAFDNGEDEFWAFDVATGVPTLLAIASPPLQAFGFTNTGTDFVMPNSLTTLVYVDPTTGQQTPYLTLSQNVGTIEGLEYVSASDGSHRITVLANTVRDQVDFGNQRRGLVLTIADASISENGGSTTATVTRNTDTTNALTVTLLSDDTSEATVVGTVVIAAGDTRSAPFNINAVNDAIVDGTQTVTFTASAADHADGTDTLNVEDDDVPALTVSIDMSSISEHVGTATGTVTRNTSTTGDLVVSLSSSDTSEASVPATVTILDGQSSATFAITGVDDFVVDGTQTVNVTASATTKLLGSYTDEFSTSSINPFWSVFTDIPGSTVAQTSGVLRLESPAAPSSFLDTGLRSSASLADSDLFAAVDFRIPQGAAMSWLSVRAFPSGPNPTVYGLYHYPPQDSYRIWIDDNITSAGSVFGQTEFGDESANWHRLSLQYDAETTTMQSFVDGVLVNTAVVDLNGGAISLFIKDHLSLGAGPTAIEFDNFSFSYETAIANGVASVDVTDNDTAGITVSAISGDTTEAGGNATFSVVLTSEPTGNVTIALSSSDASEGTVSAASLAFTTLNWNTPQTVTVTGVDDAVDDGNITYSIITAAATSGDVNYDGLNAADISVINIDNDTAGITVSSISGNTTETGGDATFSVVLTSEPTDDVTIALSSSDTSEGSATPASLVFGAGNWDVPQVVTVTGADDDVDDGDVAYSIVTAAASSSDSNYDGLNATDVFVTNIDNDTAGITVSAISGDTTEDGGTATFSVVLNSEPTADVTIGISSSDTSEGNVSAASVIFTALNWKSPQTVTVTGLDDAVDDDNITYSIVTAAATSGDVNYNGVNATDVAVTNIDNDTAGITVSAISGDTSEAGGSATFTVVLNSEPTSDVTIGISSNDTSEGTVSAASVIFTALNWSSPQTVTVTGVDDAVDDGNIAYNIITAVATSGDTNYNGVNATDVAVTNIDNDTAGITVSAISGDTSEAGGSATFTVVLNSEPTSDVTIGISSNDASEGTVSAASVIFTALNWNSPQTVTVTGVDDAVDDGNIAYNIITAVATSGDTNYNGLNAADVPLINIDNDTAGITVSAISGDTTEAGGSVTFTVVLNSEPTADVTIGISSSDTSEGSATPASLVFGAGNWNVPHVVTVTGANDDVDDGDVDYSILTAAASSSDINYGGLNADDVTLTNIDNDTAGITVSSISGNTTETGGDATFSVVLTSEPIDDVTIALSSSDTSEGSATPASLVFGAGNWNVPQVVTVTGADDDVDDGDVAYSIVTAAASSSDSNYDGLNATDVFVTNIDNDTAGITVSAISGDTTEDGGTATFSVVLNSEPTGDVTIGLLSSDPGEGTPSVSQLIIAAANWNTPHIVTVTGVDDLIVDGDIGYTILLSAATSADGLYDGLDPANVAATNRDNDVPQAFSYFPISGALVAGGTTYAAGLEPIAEPFDANDVGSTDGVVQSITEGEALVGGSKKPKQSTALDYYEWSFGDVSDVTAFTLVAWRDTNSENDDFRFEYSLDGGPWTTLTTVGAATSQTYQVDLSATPLSGALLLRVVDTDRSPVHRRDTPSRDAVHVDTVSFSSLITDLRPRVNIMATDATASESPVDNGQYTLTREGTTGDLPVFYVLGGSATAGSDYATLTGTATIPDGQSSTTITVVPFDDSDAEGNETVVAELIDNDSYGYKPGASDSATIDIIDDDLQIFTASSENTVSGSVVANSYTATVDADGVSETIAERHSGGKPANRSTYLEHRWTFTGVNAAESFYLTASRPDNSEGDDFRFEYSTNGGANWIYLTTVESPVLTLYPVDLPSTISGTILVRVIDTDPDTVGHNAQDTVNIDQMHFSTAPLAPLVADGSASVGGGFYLTQTELDTASLQAMDYWLRQDNPPSSASTSPISLEIVQLANPYLGLAYPAQNRIQIDVDAAGFGWSHNDLFATLVHEFGHLYGHDHDDMALALTMETRLAETTTLPLAAWTIGPQLRTASPLLPELPSLTNRSPWRVAELPPASCRIPFNDFHQLSPMPPVRDRGSAAMIDESIEDTWDLWLDEQLVQLLAESHFGK